MRIFLFLHEGNILLSITKEKGKNGESPYSKVKSTQRSHWVVLQMGAFGKRIKKLNPCFDRLSRTIGTG